MRVAFFFQTSTISDGADDRMVPIYTCKKIHTTTSDRCRCTSTIDPGHARHPPLPAYCSPSGLRSLKALSTLFTTYADGRRSGTSSVTDLKSLLMIPLTSSYPRRDACDKHINRMMDDSSQCIWNSKTFHTWSIVGLAPDPPHAQHTHDGRLTMFG